MRCPRTRIRITKTQRSALEHLRDAGGTDHMLGFRAATLVALAERGYVHFAGPEYTVELTDRGETALVFGAAATRHLYQCRDLLARPGRGRS